MIVRFPCQHCGARLKIDASKAGSSRPCPKCRGTMVVPTAEQVERGDLPQAGGEDENVYAEFTVFDDDDPDLLFDAEADRLHRLGHGDAAVDPDKLAVSRGIVYAQGVLLAVVAVVSFTLGLLLGSAGQKGASPQLSASAEPTLSGKLTYRDSRDLRQPDNGSVVIVLPEDKRPDEKIPIEGLAPLGFGETRPEGLVPGQVVIRGLGGAYQQADANGQFEVTLPDPGTYRVLVISAHTHRANDSPPENHHISALAGYFEEVVDLIGPNKYRFETVRVVDNETLNYDFGRSRQGT